MAEANFPGGPKRTSVSQRLWSLRRLLRDWRQLLGLRIRVAERRRMIDEYRLCRSVDDLARFAGRYLGTGICQKSSEIEAALAEDRAEIDGLSAWIGRTGRSETETACQQTRPDQGAVEEAERE